MSETKYFAVPAGYIVLSREDYDNLIEQRMANRLDRISEEESNLAELNRLNAIIESRDREIAMLKKDYIDLSDREAKIAYRLHEANEAILKLKAEIHLLNDELCRTDEFHEFHEVTHAVPEE